MCKETLLIVIMAVSLGFIPSVTSSDVTCADTSTNERWCEIGDGTVLDTTSGLYWLKTATCFGHNLNWGSAEWIANNLQDEIYGGVGCNLSDNSVAGDWRLPTQAEFLDAMTGTERIYMKNHYGGDPTTCNPGCYGPLYFFDNVAGQYYWTSTDATYGPAGARVAYLPLSNTMNFPKTVETYVWPVRESLVQEVSIDIKPGSDPNSINLCSDGAVPVAILGSDTFSVDDIDTETLRFADLTVRVVGKKDRQLCSYEDVNGDSFDDLVCHYEMTDLAAMDGDSTIATIKGELLDGTRIEGVDSVNIVKDTCN